MGALDERVLVIKNESVQKICNGETGVVLVPKDIFFFIRSKKDFL